MAKVFPAIVFVLSVSTLFAQKFHGGLTAGLSASQVAGDTYSGYDKAGLYGGGFVSLDVSQRVTLQMELTYFQKGSRKNPDSLDYSAYLLRLNYVELSFPVLFKINRFTLLAGPSAGFLVGYDEKIDYYPAYSDNPPALATLQLNLGFRFDINSRWGIDFRTNDSMLNIRKNNRTGDVWRLVDYGQYNDALVLSVFYRLYR